MDTDRWIKQEARSIAVGRVIEAPAAEIFRFLAQPANHVVLDTSGMVRGSAPGAAITGAGDVFVMNIVNDIKGDHQDENHVVIYEPDHAIGWAPAEPGQPPAGHTWTLAAGAERRRSDRGDSQLRLVTIHPYGAA